MNKDLITIPRKEYEDLLKLKELVPVFKPSLRELRVIEGGRKDFLEGKYKEWHILKNELAHLHNKSRRETN